MKKRTFLLISALTLGTLISCGPKENPPIQQEEKLEVAIKTPSKTTLEIDEELTLVAEVKNNKDNLPVTWTSSDSSVATIDASGKLKALKKGTTQITAKVGEVTSAPLVITVNEKVLAIEVAIKTPSKTTLEVDEELTLVAEVKNNKDNLPVTWTSSDSSVATIDASGKLKAIKKGSTQITAKVGEVTSAPLVITVNEKVLPIEVKINVPTSSELKVGETLSLTVEVKNNKDNLPLTWTSSDSSVATIDETGKLTALKAGESSVTAKVGDATSSPLKITVSNIEATGIKIQLEKTQIGVGEVLEVKALITPENAHDKSFTLKSSNEMKLRVDGHTIEGLTKTTADEVITLTATTSNGLSDSIELKVVALSESVLPTIEEKLAISQEKEADLLVSGEFKSLTTDKDNVETEHLNQTFEVFSDNKVEVTKDSKTKYSSTKEIRTYGEDGTFFIDVSQKINEDGTLTYSSNRTKEIIEEGSATYKQMLRSDAKKMNKLVDLGTDVNPEKATLSYYLINNAIKGTNGFAQSQAKENLKFSKVSENEFTISSNFETYSDFVDVALTLKFKESQMLESASFVTKKFDSGDFDNPTKGPLKETKTITISLTEGTRRESKDNALDFKKLSVTDYKPYLVKGYSGIDEQTTFNVGDKAYLKTKDLVPLESYSEFDAITIKEVSDTTAATIGYGGNSVTFNKEIKGLTITTISTINKVEKIITVDVNPVNATSISFPSSLHSTEFINTPIDVTISSKPTGSMANIEVRLENNTAKATATLKEGTTNTFTLNATQVGSVDVIVIDKTLGETKKITKTVKFYENSDLGIAKLLNEATVSVSTNDYLEAVDFIAEEGQTSGTIKATFYDGEATGTFVVKDGSVTCKLNPLSGYEFGEFRLYSSKDYHKFIFSFDCDWDTYSVTITLK